MLSLIPAVICGIAVICMFFYPLSDRVVKDISEKLDEKRGRMIIQ
jgi:Na+/melibiose symporter-like transporter